MKNILAITILIFLLDPAWTDNGARNSPRTRISETKCLEYKELIAQNTTHSSLSIFSVPTTIKTYHCKTYQGMIVGGEEARPGEFPHMAALGWKHRNGSVEFNCGGSLISEKFVLTAAHCLEGESPNFVRLGDHDFSTTSDEATHTDYAIFEKHVHEQYDFSTKKNDIALLELNSVVMFSDNVRPACLYQSKQQLRGNVTASGWGKTGTWSDTSDVLMKVSLNVVSNWDCYRKIGGGISAGRIYESQMCAGGKGKKDTCQGDSGGPIQLSHEDYPCIYDIVGVTSYGLLKCGKNPAVYTRVAYYLNWIEKKVWP